VHRAGGSEGRARSQDGPGRAKKKVGSKL